MPSADYGQIVAHFGAVPLRTNGAPLALSIEQTATTLQSLRLAIQLLVQNCGGVSSIYRNHVSSLLVEPEDRVAFSNDCLQMFGANISAADFNLVFTTVSEVHGALGMLRYESDTR
jgi:hypothetical protein